jgi:hypothetical protein
LRLVQEKKSGSAKFCIAKTKRRYYHLCCCYGNYMSRLTSFFYKFCAIIFGLTVACGSAFSAELTLHKVSDDVDPVNYSSLGTKARVLYVSSGSVFARASNMIDNQPSSVYSFAADDATPAVVVDLGKPVTLRSIVALYSKAHVAIDFFVLQSLPGNDDNLQTLHLDDAAFAHLTPVGSVLNEGTGRAAVEFPEMTGRYVLVKWTPTHKDKSFEVAEISVVGKTKVPSVTLANVSAATRDARTVVDPKDIALGKDAKEIPSEGPPAEGPPTDLPPHPPFVFTPVLQPTSP